jgi:hypothetical protein
LSHESGAIWIHFPSSRFNQFLDHRGGVVLSDEGQGECDGGKEGDGYGDRSFFGRASTS